MKLLTFFILFSSLFSQFSLYKGSDYMRFSGNVSFYYNNRLYDEVESNGYKKDRFGLKDARFQIKGELRKKIKYQIEVDFAKFKGDTYIDEIEEIIEDEVNKITEKMEFESFLLDAYASMKLPIKGSNITVGYFKIPFTRNNMGRSKDSPWIDRADVIEDAINRRDVGIMITQKFLSDQIIFNFATVNGRGDVTKNNDKSGSLETIARLDYTFGLNFGKYGNKTILPGRLKIADRIDYRKTPIPTIGFGFSYRYADKEENMIYDDDDQWPLAVDGIKKVKGYDIGFMYQGFSMQYDFYIKEITPNDYSPGSDSNILWFVDENNRTFEFSGQLLHLNYFFKNLNLVTSFRWEEINPNSLLTTVNTEGNLANTWNTNLGFGLCYMIDGMNTALKFQYIHRLPRGDRLTDYSLSSLISNIRDDFDGIRSPEPWKKSELRLGVQFLIR